MNEEQYDPDFEFEPDEWYCEIGLGIEEVRMMHDLLEYFIKTWPGSPARPVREQEFAQFFKQRMFVMKTEYLLENS